MCLVTWALTTRSVEARLRDLTVTAFIKNVSKVVLRLCMKIVILLLTILKGLFVRTKINKKEGGLVDIQTLRVKFVTPFYLRGRVTRLGNLLHFEQLFKAFGNNEFAQISHIFRQFL